VNEQRLREELQRTPIDDGARARALRVALAAYEPPPRRRRWAPVLVVASCLLVAGVMALSAGAPGDAVARWVRSVLGDEAPQARPALVRVPGGGRLLVTGAGGAWVVSPDGSRRRLGAYDGASWSPNGLFVVAWRGGELLALEPGGEVRWSLDRPGRIGAAAWGPVDGFRIAYLSGGAVRVVNGDGTGDRRLDAARPTPPAWRPDDDHVLAYVDRRGRVRVVAVDSGRELWRSRAGAGAEELAWAPDGRRLLVASRSSWLVLGSGGRVLERRSLPEGLVADDFAWAADGRLAVVRRSARRSDVVVDGRVLFTGSGRFGDVAFSPDGRRLLVPWPRADQWLFLPAAGGRLSAVANIGRQFAGGARPGRFPDRVEWISSAAAR